MPIPLVTRILVADDHALVRSGLRKVLDTQPDLRVVAEAQDGAEAVERALADEVDLAILDVSMPRLTGIQAAAQLQRLRSLGGMVAAALHQGSTDEVEYGPAASFNNCSNSSRTWAQCCKRKRRAA